MTVKSIGTVVQNLEGAESTRSPAVVVRLMCVDLPKPYVPLARKF